MKQANKRYYANGGQTLSDEPLNITVTQRDHLLKGRKSINTSSPRGAEESGKNILSRGSKGDEVLQLQQYLKAQGLYSGAIDGIFGPKTEQAVKQFQRNFNALDTSDNRVSYTQNGITREIGSTGSKIAVDGIVGDETRSALMYRKMPKPAPKVRTPEVPKVPGTIDRDYTTTDNIGNAGPVAMDYAGGLALLGMAALPGLAAEAAAATSAETGIANTLTRVGGNFKAPRAPLNPTGPGQGATNIPRSFQPRTPSSYGTRVAYNTGGDISSVLGAASPLVSLIPGMGGAASGLSILSSLASGLGSMLNSDYDKRIGKSPGAYAMGGDISLSKESFQVKGNPKVYDSEAYHSPQGQLNLDHNEVVKGTFAFSNRLRNPATGNTFADDTAPIERSTGRLSKRNQYYNDPITSRTISLNEDRVEKIASAQETIATLMGKRNAQGMDPKNAAYQSGGTIQGDTNKPFMQVGGDYYYDPYQGRYLWRNPFTGSYTQEEGTPGFGSGKGFRPYAKIENDMLIPQATTTQDTPIAPRSISQFRSRYEQPYQQASPTDWEKMQFGQEGTTPGGTLPEVTVSATGATKSAPKRRGIPDKPLSRTEEFAANMEMQRAYMRTGEAPELTDNPLGLTQYSQAPTLPSVIQSIGQMLNQRASHTGDTFNTSPTPNAAPQAPSTATPPITQDGRITGRTTVGDIFQGVEVGSKFAQLIGGPEVEKPYLDSTQITKQSYDPTSALYQNQANFQKQSNALQTSSPTLRRALQNNFYAKKLDADSRILTQYKELNNQATTQYQDRLSNRSRYNNQQQMVTNDLNARNRGQYQNAVQNAFTSLGNFGEALNDKKKNYDALNILRLIYPDVYGRISKSI